MSLEGRLRELPDCEHRSFTDTQYRYNCSFHSPPKREPGGTVTAIICLGCPVIFDLPAPEYRISDAPKPTKELGDVVSSALALVGITQEKVSHWLGRSCGCASLQQRLNRLSRWAKRTMKGVIGNPKKRLKRMMGK